MFVVFSRVFASIVKVLKREFQGLMEPKSKTHSWPNTTQRSDWQQVAAFEWFLEYMSNPAKYPDGPDSAWMSCFVGSPGQVVVNVKEHSLVLIFAVVSFSFLGWNLEVVEGGDNGNSIFSPSRHFALKFFHVPNLQDWLSVPCLPILGGQTGPLRLQQQGQAMESMFARIEEGLNMSVQAAKDLLRHLEIPFKGNASRSTLLHMIVDAFLQKTDERQEAYLKMGQAMNPKLVDDDDSDYEALLEHVEQNENQGDADLKQEKLRLKQKKRRTLVAAVAASGSMKKKRKSKAKAKSANLKAAKMKFQKKMKRKNRFQQQLPILPNQQRRLQLQQRRLQLQQGRLKLQQRRLKGQLRLKKMPSC